MTTAVTNWEQDQALVLRDDDWAAVGAAEDITARWNAMREVTDDDGKIAEAVILSYAAGVSTEEFLARVAAKVERDAKLDKLLRWARRRATEGATL